MKKSLHIAILGCRGIPNHYGGFEQLATELSKGLISYGHKVVVYNTHDHPYREDSWNGVEIIHCYNPESAIGMAGQFVYDLNCIRDAGKKAYDVIIFLGYTSSSIWGRWFPRSVIISNMDGMEWQRSKYSRPVQWFLRKAESLAVRHSHFFIADSVIIRDYLKKKYDADSKYIAYGAHEYGQYDDAVARSFGLTPGKYMMLMARMEPENNIEMILRGFVQSGSRLKMLVLGNVSNDFGKKMKKQFGGHDGILFAGAIFDPHTTHNLRRFATLYFHGHSAGGTNPSLLEAMADGVMIAAHDNGFNRAVLEDDGVYFASADDVASMIRSGIGKMDIENCITANKEKIASQYNWPYTVAQYECFIQYCYNRKKR